jgi:inosine-uridine nucleoside N-ribohydrolase
MLASSWAFESVRLIRLSGVIAERSIADDRAGASRAVVVSTDCGADCDDQWAIAHLALIPTIDLKAIVTSHAPGLTPAAAAAKAREVLGTLGLDKAPRVIEGASAPLPRADSPRDTPGARTLIDEARGRSPRDRLTVVMIGAATDVASALLIDPSLADRIEVVAMGFESYPKGTDPWNVKNDVIAWRIVLESTVRLVVGDSVVSRRRLKMNPTEAKRVLPKDDPVSRMLIAELVRRLDENPALAEKETGEKRTWPIWDEVTVAYLLGLTKTKTVPRLRLLDDLTFDQERSAGTIDWVTEIDRDALFRDLAHRIKINGERKRK